MLRTIRMVALCAALLILPPALAPDSLSAQNFGQDPAAELNQALGALRPEEGRKYRVDIITMSPLEAIYGIWGHTSLRIHNAELGGDYIFDWGVFDFDDTFLFRFLKGEPAYLLAARPLRAMLNYYGRIDRVVYTQQLMLTDEQAARLFALVARDVNQTYIYHHYNNNCVTKIRDIVDVLDRGQLKAWGQRPAEKTFRDTSNEYAGNIWHWIGINLIQGTTVDQPVNVYEEMYLPIAFMDRLEEYRAERLEKGETSVVGPKIQIMRGAPPAEPSGWITVPLITGVLIGLLFALPAARPDHGFAARIGRIARNAWHIIAGFVGIVLAIFWLFTGHDSMINNINLLAFAPILLFVPIVARIYRGRRETMEKVYLALVALPVLGLVLMITTLWPQPALAFLLPAAVVQGLIWFGYKRGV